MKAVTFPGSNVVYAEDQPDYLPLPALRFPVTGRVIHCWEPTHEELQDIKRTGKIYFSQETGNGPLQPVMCAANIESLFHDGVMPIVPVDLKEGDRIIWTVDPKHFDADLHGAGWGYGVVSEVNLAEEERSFLVDIGKVSYEFLFEGRSPSWEPASNHVYKIIAKVL